MYNWTKHKITTLYNWLVGRPLYKLCNFWRFKKVIWDYHPWDFDYNMMLFIKSLEITAKHLKEKGDTESSIVKSKEIYEFINLYKKIEHSVEYYDLEDENKMRNELSELFKKYHGWWD